jgi:hypothetical protein
LNFLALVTAQFFVVLDVIVVQQRIDQVVRLACRPSNPVGIDVLVVDAAQVFLRELTALADQFRRKVVGDTGGTLCP